jgi:hypothetical protein
MFVEAHVVFVPIIHHLCPKVKVQQFLCRTGNVWGFQRVEALSLQDIRHMEVVRLSAVFTPKKYYCYWLIWSQGHSAPGRIKSMKNSSDTIQNRNCYLLACSAVPQPTASSRTQFVSEFNQNVEIATTISSILRYKIPWEFVPFKSLNKDKWTNRKDEDWQEVLKRHRESKWILFCEEKYLRNKFSWEWFLDK